RCELAAAAAAAAPAARSSEPAATLRPRAARKEEAARRASAADWRGRRLCRENTARRNIASGGSGVGSAGCGVGCATSRIRTQARRTSAGCENAEAPARGRARKAGNRVELEQDTAESAGTTAADAR